MEEENTAVSLTVEYSSCFISVFNPGGLILQSTLVRNKTLIWGGFHQRF